MVALEAEEGVPLSHLLMRERAVAESDLMAAVANELQAFLDRKPTTVDRSRLLHVALWSRRNPQLALFIVVAVALTAISAGAHATVTRLRGERAALNREVDARKTEQARLNASVEHARAELDDMKSVVREVCEEGSFGLSTGLDYPPGSYADTHELIEISKVVARAGGFYHTHTRAILKAKGLLAPWHEAQPSCS